MEKRITLFADSLALPRAEDWGNVPYEKTYPYLLEKALREVTGYENHVFTNRAKRFNTLPKTAEEFDDFANLKSANTIILHCGIVDCAPRVFDEKQRKFVSRLPSLLQKITLKVVHLFRKIIIQHIAKNKTYVSETSFKNSFEAIFKKAKTKKIIILNILNPNNVLEQRSPGFQSNARRYNAIINTYTGKSEIIDVNTLLNNEEHTVDGMHPNVEGNHRIFKALLERIVQ